MGQNANRFLNRHFRETGAYGLDVFNGDFRVGGVPIYGGVGAGRCYFLDPVNGLDTNNGRSPHSAFKTFPVAYAALRDGKHDTLYYLSDETTGISLSAAVDWAKNQTHFVGVGAPVKDGQRARLSQASTAASLSPLFKVSGQNCMFQNLRFYQGVDNAASKICFQVTGQRNTFVECNFAGGGHATCAVDGGASLNIVGSASGGSENRFIGCTIGLSTIPAGTGFVGLLITGSGAARNVFEDCKFTLKSGNTGCAFVELGAIGAIDRETIFDRCTFINLAATGIATAFVVPAGFDPNDKRFLLRDCALVGATDWDKDDRGALLLNNGILTGGGNAGFFAASAAT